MRMMRGGSPGGVTWALVVATLCLALCRGSSATTCNAGDRNALLTFKGQLIDTAKVLDPWKPNTDCCKWPGVSCDSAGRVTILNLLDVFAFPDANNQKLKVKSGLYAAAGASLGNLKALKELEFRNVLFGYAYPIPAALGSLPVLSSLHLIDTQFVGAIPALPKSLTHLILAGNRFPDGIPDSFGTLAALTSLQLPNNQIKKVGSQRITALKKLVNLDLSQNLITGPIPTWFGRLTLSDFIQLADNPFSGPIPGELCSIQGLKRIIIFDTQVTALPSTIANCVTLTELVLFDNKIAGSLPASLGKLKKLERISLKNNKLTGSLPREIGDIKTLTEFDIGNNRITGSIPPNYGPFVEDELSTDFSGNLLSGPIPSLLSNLRARVFTPGNPGLCGKPLAACKR